jgi:tripartite-type tricarboxylate transporter receptor subunit TctC
LRRLAHADVAHHGRRVDPAIGEIVPGYQMMGWYSIVVPRGTPEAITAKITKEVAAAVKEPEFGEQLKGLGLEMSGITGSEFDGFRRDQRKRITEIVKASGVDLK